MNSLCVQEKRISLIAYNLTFKKAFFLISRICISNCCVIKTMWTVATWNQKMKGNHLYRGKYPTPMQACLNIRIIFFLCLIIGVRLSSKFMPVYWRSECDPETSAFLCWSKALALRELNSVVYFGDKGLCQNSC